MSHLKIIIDYLFNSSSYINLSTPSKSENTQIEPFPISYRICTHMNGHMNINEKGMTNNIAEIMGSKYLILRKWLMLPIWQVIIIFFFVHQLFLLGIPSENNWFLSKEDSPSLNEDKIVPIVNFCLIYCESFTLLLSY